MAPYDIIAKEMYKAYVQIFKMKTSIHSQLDLEKRDYLINKLVEEKKKNQIFYCNNYVI